MRNFKPLFNSFFVANPGRLHFAAHSHHPWPDVSFEAQKRYWMDSVRLTDMKWEEILNNVVPAVQAHIARRLNLDTPASIAFAPNTHEFVCRLLSCLPPRPRILTTDSEFHSFERQMRRLEEDGLADVTRIATEPFDTFPARFADAMKTGHDMVFFSHVFFNSGYAVPDLGALAGAVPDKDTVLVIDGYHAFMALPVDLPAVQNRAFYLAGGYKYAMSGEGVCFMHCPPGYGARPRDTGWFADMSALEETRKNTVGFATDGFRFWGATFDPSGLYRMRAVMDMLEDEKIGVDDIHAHVIDLQHAFIKAIGVHMPGTLITPVATDWRGHFLTFETGQSSHFHKAMLQKNIIVDYRGTRLRFGFGIYQDKEDIKRLSAIFK